MYFSLTFNEAPSKHINNDSNHQRQQKRGVTKTAAE
jgi:hypothetical protein